MGRSATCEVSSACAKMPSSSPRTICLILAMEVGCFARSTHKFPNSTSALSPINRRESLGLVNS